jgi:ABC-2 type transport system ATP-binding protein
MKHKLGIVQALQSDPPLLILDEPTEGLDPLMQESFYQILTDLRRRGRTIFMSSHVLSEVERVCTGIGLIRKGELVLLSTVEDIRKRAPRRVRVLFDRDVVWREVSLPEEIKLSEVQPRAWSFDVHGPVGPLVQLLSGAPVHDIEVTEPRLEEILIRYYREESS